MTRRSFIGWALAYTAAFAVGAIGGCADRREPRREEPQDGGEEPP